jgi:hypothetical protein
MKKSLLLTKTWRFHNDVYVFRSKGFREDFGQFVRRRQLRCLVGTGLELVEILVDTLVGRDGNFPKDEGVGWNVVKCGLLFNLDCLLEVPDGICRSNFDWEDAARVITVNPTEKFDCCRHGDCWSNEWQM